MTDLDALTRTWSGTHGTEPWGSLALRLTFRAADRTLTDEEVAERRVAIEAAVAKIGGSLRE